MKYSLLSLLLATGYVALMVAAMRQPDSGWRVVATVAWLGIVLYLIAMAIDPLTGSKAVFSRVVLAGLATYLSLGVLIGDKPTIPNSLLPHVAFADWWAPHLQQTWQTASTPPATFSIETAGSPALLDDPFGSSTTPVYNMFQTSSGFSAPTHGAVRQLAALNLALLFGLLGGCVVRWRHWRAGRQRVAFTQHQ